jgi:transcription initiation factor TFIIIB Brf1 subunit/transcription initiation factor TFIIB
MPTCSECGGTKFDSEDGANTTCVNCGKILSSGRIVEEITFTGEGGSGVDGRLVGNEKVEVSSGAARIRELAELLALGSAVTESALRIYSLAKDKHFTNGRKIDQVLCSFVSIILD